MKNPDVCDLVKKRFKAETKQGGTMPEGTSTSPQAGVTDQIKLVRGGGVGTDSGSMHSGSRD